MIREVQGNLLADDAQALVNTVNTVGVMGKGIALQFKRAYPDMFRAYEADAKAGQVAPGVMHVWESQALTGPRYIINFPTKRHWRAPSRLADIDEGLADLARVIVELGITSVAVPPLGCGNGGLEWADVAPRIRAALGALQPDVDVRLYVPAGAPPAREMVTRTEAPELTPSRAALLALMLAYHQLTWTWPAHVDVQKLAYFLQATGRDLRLRFEKGHFGPYADNLRRTLSEMEGHQILGFGDGSAPALQADPIEVREGVAAQLHAVLGGDTVLVGQVSRVLELVDGFSTTYGLELLASVHWVVTREAAQSPVEAESAVRRWTGRKAALFGQDHVRRAWMVLQEGSWFGEVDAAAAAS